MGWASIEEVAAYTGETVTAPQLAQAEATIDLATGRTYAEDSARTNSRDTYWIKLAVCYQAAWMLAQPDMFARTNVRSVAQEGGGTTALTDDALTVAPLAKQAIERLSWRRSRSLHTRSRASLSPGVDDDDDHDWQPL